MHWKTTFLTDKIWEIMFWILQGKRLTWIVCVLVHIGWHSAVDHHSASRLCLQWLKIIDVSWLEWPLGRQFVPSACFSTGFASTTSAWGLASTFSWGTSVPWKSFFFTGNTFLTLNLTSYLPHHWKPHMLDSCPVMSEEVAACVLLSCSCPTLQNSLKAGCVPIAGLTSISFPDASGSPTRVMEREMPLARQVLWWGGARLQRWQPPSTCGACFSPGVDSCKLANLLLPVVLLLELACQAQLRGRSEVRLIGCAWRAGLCIGRVASAANSWEGEATLREQEVEITSIDLTQVRLWVHRRKLWVQCPSLHWPVFLHALGWETCIKTSLHSLMHREAPVDAHPELILDAST